MGFGSIKHPGETKDAFDRHEPGLNKNLPPVVYVNLKTGAHTPEKIPDKPKVVESVIIGPKIDKKSAKGRKQNKINPTALRPAEEASSPSFHGASVPPQEEAEIIEEPEYIPPPKVPVRIAGSFGEIRTNVLRVVDNERMVALVIDLDDENYYVPPISKETPLTVKVQGAEYSVLYLGLTIEDQGLMFIILIKV